MNMTKIVLTAAYVAFVAATLFSVGNVGQYFDVASFIFVVVVAGFCVTVAGGESAVSKFGTGAVRAGWLGSMIGIIAIFGSAGFASGDLSQIGPALAVCSLTVFYGYFFKIGAIILEG
ncbi:hypothetical protein N8760_06620 [Rhodobacteraceae bacterium]|jgi:hypothetical protein|nr:hypothetical protein [Paracoccaceae bacterium]